MMAGEEKYGRFNYTKGHNLTDLTAAASRHLKQIEAGEDIDADCSEKAGVEVEHAACVCANMLMLLHQKELKTLIDNRFKAEQDRDSDWYSDKEEVRIPGGAIYFHTKYD